MKIYSEEKKLQFFFSAVGNAIWKYVAFCYVGIAEVGIVIWKTLGRKKLYMEILEIGDSPNASLNRTMRSNFDH